MELKDLKKVSDGLKIAGATGTFLGVIVDVLMHKDGIGELINNLKEKTQK